ncbi:MAG: hypothetical protein IPJ61_21310 [Tessaracoccus sp.]|uniref:hypothetical protein n=1 Tax=Tessaracoccus sp. TaxID=1971211 RepID=UPI001ECC22A5|nr:hypothetical protein [Tessaracoccus sp.]MBK7823528.1 hypothetical protein [Tessaracoccus sp.]
MQPQNSLQRRASAHLAHWSSFGVALLAVLLTACSETPTSCPTSTGDLDGDGSITDLDCAMAAIGGAVRGICAGDPKLWLSNDRCASITRTTLATGALEDVRTLNELEGFVATVGGRVAVAMPPRYDEPPDSWTTTVSSGNEVAGSLTVTDGSLLTLVAGNRVWFDINGDLTAQPSEVILISTILGTQVSDALAAVSFDGHAVVSGVGTGNRLMVWTDLSDDLRVTADEIELLPSDRAPIGLDRGVLTYFDSQLNGPAYWSGSTTPTQRLEVAVECGRLGSPESANFTCLAPRLTAGMIVASQAAGGSPIVTVRRWMPGRHLWLGMPLRMTPASGIRERPFYAAVHYSDASGFHTWLDENMDFEIQDREVVSIASGEAVELATNSEFLAAAVEYLPAESAPQVLGVVPTKRGGVDELIGIVRRPATAFLGEACSGAAPCASGLACTALDDRTLCTDAQGL